MEVPYLRGMSLRQAEISLQESGLRLGSAHYVSGIDAPAGAVIGTHPEARVLVERGRVVDVDISSGAAQSPDRMPSLIGFSLSQARDQIEALHLTVGEITQRADAKNLPQTVLSQIPPPGAPLKGEPVDLVVSQ
jgi:serine/threonine-protein kinase